MPSNGDLTNYYSILAKAAAISAVNKDSFLPIESQQQQLYSLVSQSFGRNNDSQVVQDLFKQLESQQFTNYILKSKLASLQVASASQPSAESDVEATHKAALDSPKAILESLLYNKFLKATLLQNHVNNGSVSLNSFAKEQDESEAEAEEEDEEVIEHIGNKRFKPNQDDQEQLYESPLNNQDDKPELTENEEDMEGQVDGYEKKRTKNGKISKTKHKRDRILDSSKTIKSSKKQMKLLLSNSVNGGESVFAAMTGLDGSGGGVISSVKTPKSALLDKRRKAVFELLQEEIYPSGKACLVKHLCSKNSDFLTAA